MLKTVQQQVHVVNNVKKKKSCPQVIYTCIINIVLFFFKLK